MPPRKTNLRWTARLTAALIFAVAAWLLASALIKLDDPAAFQRVLAAQGRLPDWSLWWVARAVPVGELVAAIIALLGLVHARASVGALTLASVFFALALYCTLLVWLPPPAPTSCGCGLSRAPVTNWAPLALRNALLASALAVGAWVSERRPSVLVTSAPRPEPSPLTSSAKA